MTTVPLNILYGLWCGGCLGACAAPRGVPETVPWAQLIKLPLIFAALSVVPAAMGLAGQFPDWSLMYLTDPQRLPRLWIVGAGLLAGAAVALGFVLGCKGARRYGAQPLWVALAVLLLIYLGLCAWGWRSGRLSEVGSFADFQAGGWLMQPVLGLAPGMAPGMAITTSLGGELSAQRPAGLFYALLATNLCVGTSLVLVARTLLTKSEFIFAAALEVPARASATAPNFS